MYFLHALWDPWYWPIPEWPVDKGGSQPSQCEHDGFHFTLSVNWTKYKVILHISLRTCAQSGDGLCRTHIKGNKCRSIFRLTLRAAAGSTSPAKPATNAAASSTSLSWIVCSFFKTSVVLTWEVLCALTGSIVTTSLSRISSLLCKAAMANETLG